jgi:hypothetical protein
MTSEEGPVLPPGLDLLRGGADRAAEGAGEFELEGDGWRARLRCWAIVQRERPDRHPWITQIPTR